MSNSTLCNFCLYIFIISFILLWISFKNPIFTDQPIFKWKPHSLTKSFSPSLSLGGIKFFTSSSTTSKGSSPVSLVNTSKIYWSTVCGDSIVKVDIFNPLFVCTSSCEMYVFISSVKSWCSSMVVKDLFPSSIIFCRPNNPSMTTDPTLIS